MRGTSSNAWDDQIVTPYGLHDDLAAVAAMWQTRAAHLEDQLKRLAPGEIVPETTPEPPELTETSGSVLHKASELTPASVAIVTMPALPTWWPPSGSQQLAGRRLGYFDAVKIVHLAARTHDETVSVAIGLRPDGRLATLEGTPKRRQQEWVLWEG